MADPVTAGFVALKAGGAVAKGFQGRAENLNEAAKAEAQARLADTQAFQRDTLARGELDRFLSSMAASRAANGLSSVSPNALVLQADARNKSDNERLRNRADDRQRAANFRAAAKGYKSRARFSLATGLIKGGLSIGQGYENGAFG
jgi:hypothetical protein